MIKAEKREKVKGVDFISLIFQTNVNNSASQTKDEKKRK